MKALREMLTEREKRLDEALSERREAELKLDQMTLKASVSTTVAP